MKPEHDDKTGTGDLDPAGVELVSRLLEIIAAEGLVKPELLEPHATVDDIGFTIDDLTLIGNAIEREYDCDMMPDEAMQRCKTVRELVELMGRRIQRAASGEGR
ncbi:phosphopantetheine-binding protein [Bosea robiniae]|uniref:Phosphopantetheine attachment site n=1 Tax=Bosea robiniae TaxID=1036780 RepID=A0ABY0P9X9_9HYPH|nr:phosphopantetheine-binding protein [Bosea robiniae]SDH79378.1 Phosphopantetheine attachment site [Bosea robiniae]